MQYAMYAKNQKEKLRQETLRKKQEDQNLRLELLETIKQQSKKIRSLQCASRHTRSEASDYAIEDLTLDLNLSEK